MHQCRAIGCPNLAVENEDFCTDCLEVVKADLDDLEVERIPVNKLDPFLVNQLFDIQDPSGCIQHASRNLLLSNQDGGQHMLQRIKEARNALNRWLEINGH